MSRAKKHTCDNCDTECQTKKMLDGHKAICKYIHTPAREHKKNNEIHRTQLPSQHDMLQIIIQLNNRVQELEQKMAKIQQTTQLVRRKCITQYLKELPPPEQTYSQWLSGIHMTESAIQPIFQAEITDPLVNCAKLALAPLLTEYAPIRAFEQKRLTLYLYDNEWRAMTTEEFAKLSKIVSHKILQTYAHWARQNTDILHKNEKAEEQSLIYMCRASGRKQGSEETRIAELKKWVFNQISVSVKQLE